MKRSSRYGFTMVEMLVTIAIIGVLCFLLSIALQNMLAQVQSAKCLSNLKGLAAACLLYSAEHDNYLVPAASGTANSLKTWRALISDYTGGGPGRSSIFICPSDTSRPNPYPQYFASGIRPSSYGLNQSSSTAADRMLHEYLDYARGKKLSQVSRPTRTIMICDLGSPANASGQMGQWTQSTDPRSNYGYARFPDDVYWSSDKWWAFPRHGKTRNRMNAVFFDGHAESLDYLSEIVAYPLGTAGCLYDNP